MAHSRVGMWRGGGRIGLSVSAPFVWRCLNSRANFSVSTPTGSPEAVNHVRFRGYLSVHFRSGLQAPCLRFAVTVTRHHARLGTQLLAGFAAVAIPGH